MFKLVGPEAGKAFCSETNEEQAASLQTALLNWDTQKATKGNGKGSVAKAVTAPTVAQIPSPKAKAVRAPATASDPTNAGAAKTIATAPVSPQATKELEARIEHLEGLILGMARMQRTALCFLATIGQQVLECDQETLCRMIKNDMDNNDPEKIISMTGEDPRKK
jgi:hypothetical protein